MLQEQKGCWAGAGWSAHPLSCFAVHTGVVQGLFWNELSKLSLNYQHVSKSTPEVVFRQFKPVSLKPMGVISMCKPAEGRIGLHILLAL